MELEILGSKCKKYSALFPCRKRALRISLFLNDPFCNIEWRSTRPKTSGLFIKDKKPKQAFNESGLRSLFTDLPSKTPKIICQTPSPLKTPQKRNKKVKAVVYSPATAMNPSEVALVRYNDKRKAVASALSKSLNIEKMQFSPIGKNYKRKLQARLQ